MSDPKFEGKVLFVDDDRRFRELYEREAERAGVDDFTVFEDAPSAVAGIKSLDEAAAAIFSALPPQTQVEGVLPHLR